MQQKLEIPPAFHSLSILIRGEPLKICVLDWKEIETLDFVHLMQPDDSVGVLTKNGKFVAVVSISHEYLLKRADQLQEAMIFVMKRPESKSGVWFWRMSKDWKSLNGLKLEEDTCNS